MTDYPVMGVVRVKAGMVYLQVKLWSMPERFEIYIVYKKALYKYSSFPFKWPVFLNFALTL